MGPLAPWLHHAASDRARGRSATLPPRTSEAWRARGAMSGVMMVNVGYLMLVNHGVRMVDVG